MKRSFVEGFGDTTPTTTTAGVVAATTGAATTGAATTTTTTTGAVATTHGAATTPPTTAEAAAPTTRIIPSTPPSVWKTHMNIFKRDLQRLWRQYPGEHRRNPEVTGYFERVARLKYMTTPAGGT